MPCLGRKSKNVHHLTVKLVYMRFNVGLVGPRGSAGHLDHVVKQSPSCYKSTHQCSAAKQKGAIMSLQLGRRHLDLHLLYHTRHDGVPMPGSPNPPMSCSLHIQAPSLPGLLVLPSFSFQFQGC